MANDYTGLMIVAIVCGLIICVLYPIKWIMDSKQPRVLKQDEKVKTNFEQERIRKRLLYIDVLTILSLLMGLLAVGSQFFKPRLYTFGGAIGLLYCSYFLFKRDKKAIRLVYAFSIGAGGVGLIILIFYLVALFSKIHYPDDYWMGVTGGSLILWAITTSFYITRPAVKAQFK